MGGTAHKFRKTKTASIAEYWKSMETPEKSHFFKLVHKHLIDIGFQPSAEVDEKGQWIQWSQDWFEHRENWATDTHFDKDEQGVGIRAGRLVRFFMAKNPEIFLDESVKKDTPEKEQQKKLKKDKKAKKSKVADTEHIAASEWILNKYSHRALRGILEAVKVEKKKKKK